MLKPDDNVFLLVDGHALIYRAYHAFPPLTSPNGEIVGALYGFLRILFSTIRELEPKYVAATFDHPAPTKRKQAYAFYKANRSEMPDDLKPQVDLIKEAVASLGIPVFTMAGIEADDLIGTITKKTAPLTDLQTLILTGDRDSFQLVDEHTQIYLSQIGLSKKISGGNNAILVDEKIVVEKMGVPPAQIIDLKALSGDPSDNIPGVAGIGKVSATKLLQTYGSLDAIYKVVDAGGDSKLLKGKLLEKLRAGKKDAYISQELATIDRDVELNFHCEHCELSNYNQEEASALLKDYGFTSLLKLLPKDSFEAGVQAELF
jgi:DNA polymerase-1